MVTVTDLGWCRRGVGARVIPVSCGRWLTTQGRDDAESLIRSLYAEHGRSLLAYATRLTGDRAAAEDVVQETLLRAWKHADDLTSGKGRCGAGC